MIKVQPKPLRTITDRLETRSQFMRDIGVTPAMMIGAGLVLLVYEVILAFQAFG